MIAQATAVSRHAAAPGRPRLTIAITTRNRSGALLRCLDSLRHVRHLRPEVFVFDDGSDVPVAEDLRGRRLPVSVGVIGDRAHPGYIIGRNRLVRAAGGPFVLLLDDDAALLDGAAVERGLALMERDSKVAAIAFAQTDRAGVPWPEPMQAGRGTTATYVASFIGFAHLLRKDAFLAIGGYRELFQFYGEEKDLCLRLIEAGFQTVYLPDARVAHEPASTGRSGRRYLRFVTRNDCLNAMYNQPLHRLVWMLPVRLLLYFHMRRSWRIRDPWGWAWVVRQLAAALTKVRMERKPVSAATRRTWAHLRKHSIPYAPADRIVNAGRFEPAPHGNAP